MMYDVRRQRIVPFLVSQKCVSGKRKTGGFREVSQAWAAHGPLGEDMIEQYAVFIGETSIGQLAGCRRLLSPAKAMKVDRFRFEKDKIRGILGETMVRYLAETRFGLPGRRLSFATEENGKPFLTGEAQALRFNLSHAGDWVVCAIGDEPTGIDVEQVKDAGVNIAERVMTPGEYRRWMLLPEAERLRAFYRAWTAKESYAKYRGEGLGLDFAELEILPEGDGYSRVGGDEFCALYTRDLTPEDILTVCAARGTRQELERPVIMLTAESLADYADRQ